MIAAREPNSGSLVAWDGEFRFWADSPPTLPGPNNLKAAAATGAAFLLGVFLPCVVVRLDEDGCGEVCSVHGIEAIESFGVFEGGLSQGRTLVVFGPGVRNSDAVSMVCRLCPFARVLVSPLDEGTLAAAGVLAEHLLKKNLDRPRRVPLDEPSRDFLEAVGQDLDESLGSDGIGRMAYLMRGGMPVCNQTMLRRGVSPFHGRVLSVTGWWSNPVFLMNSQTADTFFPEEPISTKVYAATGVPVRVMATEEFKKETKWPKDEVDLFVSSEDTAGLPTMLNLVSLSCGRKWLASSDPKDVAIPASMPLFRHNRAYNVGGELWSRVVLHEAN